jgi:hypothetical protein
LTVLLTGAPLAVRCPVDRGVIATAAELFDARHFPGVIAMCTDALEDEPECVPLLMIRARAHAALRRDLDAQADLRDVIRLDPWCAHAYRLLGELAARHDENAAAAQFFREALRLDPDDREARDWLMIVAPSRPVAGAAKLPAPAPAAGRFSSPQAPAMQARLARGTAPPERGMREPPDSEERPTPPLVRSPPRGPAPQAQRPAPRPTSPGRDGLVEAPAFAEGTERQPPRPTSYPAVRLVVPVDPGESSCPPRWGDPGALERPTTPTLRGHLPLQRPAKEAPRLGGRATGRGPIPELPGFDEYLVANGILSRERLRAAQAYQRSMNVRLSTAIVTLGLATPQRIEWAAVAHQSEVARDRQP